MARNPFYLTQLKRQVGRKSFKPSLLIATVMLLLACMLAACGETATSGATAVPAITTSVSATSAAITSVPAITNVTSSSSNIKISVVAAENFYGDVAQQIGGGNVQVTSILSDPNTDPHEFESNVQTGIAVNKAQLVIKNGSGYDDWMDKLLSASPNNKRTVITAFDLATVKLPDNPHVWNNPDDVVNVAQAIAESLKKYDLPDAATFDGNLQKFKLAVIPLKQKFADLKTKYAGTPIGLSETIYLFETDLIGLKVLTPFEFDKAIAEGNDPPADTVAIANDQISKKQIKLLIVNAQTSTPFTDNLQTAAKQQNIPVVFVTETEPPDAKSYQDWQLNQLNLLEQSLQKALTK